MNQCELEREKLAKLLIKYGITWYPYKLVDYLLKNGVVVLPCKCDKCSHRCNNTNECGIYGRICTENGYCEKALKGGLNDE